MPPDPTQYDDLRASVIDRFAGIATAPEQERSFRVGPASARRLDIADWLVIDTGPPRRPRR